jgi:hypothetical protein
MKKRRRNSYAKTSRQFYRKWFRHSALDEDGRTDAEADERGALIVKD